MKTILVPAFDTPLVSLCLANRAGTIVDPPGLEGAVCQMAELSLRGAGPLGREAIDERIDGLGAFIGFALRRDYLSLQAGCLHRNLDALVSIAALVLNEPRMEEDERQKLVRETQNDLDELRDDDGSLAQRFFAKHSHPGHVYARTALGTEASLAAIDLQALLDLRDTLFADDQLVLGIAGPVSDEEAADISASLSSERRASPERPSLQPPTLAGGRRLILVDKPDRKQCQVAMGHLVPAYGSAEHDHLRIAETAFGGMFSSRLMQEIRVKHGWSYGASCNLYRARGQHSLHLSMAPSAEVCAQAVAKMLEMFSALRDEGLTEEEFALSRSYLVGSAAFSRATANQRLFRQVQEEIFELPVGFGNRFPERIEATTRGTTNETIAQCLRPEDLCVVVVCSADKMLSELASIGGFDSVEVLSHQSY